MSAPLTPEGIIHVKEACHSLLADINEAMAANTEEEKQVMKELVVASVKVGYQKGIEQTSAQDERIKELEEQLRRRTAERDGINEHKEHWKKESKVRDAQIGEQEKGLHEAQQQRNDVCNEYSIIKTELEELKDSHVKIIIQQAKCEQERDQLLEKVEQLEKESGKHCEEAVRQGNHSSQLAIELEAVKKERDTVRLDLKIVDEALSKSINQRDQAIDLLEEWETFKGQLAAYLMECDYKCTGGEVSDFLDEFSPLLSSREKKNRNDAPGACQECKKAPASINYKDRAYFICVSCNDIMNGEQ